MMPISDDQDDVEDNMRKQGELLTTLRVFFMKTNIAIHKRCSMVGTLPTGKGIQAQLFSEMNRSLIAV